MKKYIVAVLLIGLFAFTRYQQEALAIGSNLPKGDVKMKDVSGELITLAGAKKENGLLVMFSCNTCPYVLKNRERTREICEYALANNIGVVLLNANEDYRNGADSYAAMKEFAKAENYKWYYAVDSRNEIADAFGANRTPECFLFSSSLKLIYHGAIDDNPADAGNVSRRHLKEAITETINQKDISVKQSRSVGCGIKRKG